jgi:hypothetical protein
MKRKVGIVIDRLTNSIVEVASGTSFETDLVLVGPDEIKKVHKKDKWRFNWKREFKEENHQLYKLVLDGDIQIQGLDSLQPMAQDLFIEMHLIENAPHNFGEDKQYEGVAGNMVAFACKRSFELGFDGFVAFTAKTKLVDHYIETLGAQVIYSQDRMGIFTPAAQNLVSLYYKDFFDGGQE